MAPVVLITGCSTGIGRNLAQRLTRAGYTVVATARRPEALADLPMALKLPLDVTQPDSITQAVDCTLQRFGQIDVLVNNAGYAMFGAVEEIADDQVQQLFDVNVFGVLRMIRAVVPQMRQQGRGRIINLSSLVGKVVMPVNGPYAATKFAVEALSDALRLELAPFGITVVVIEPGGVTTQFSPTATAYARPLFANPGSPYRRLYQQFQQVTAAMSRQTPGPEAVSVVIERVLRTARPKARYLVAVPLSGRLVVYLRDLLWNPVVRQLFKPAM